MNLEFFITKRIAFSGNKSFSNFIAKIAVTAVALSVAVMVITTALVNGFQDEISRKIFGFWGHIHISSFDSSRSFEDTHPISKNQPFVKSLDTLANIHHIQVYAHKPGIIKTDTDIEGVILKGLDTDFDWDFFKQYLIEGEPLALSDTGKVNEVIISKITSNRLRLKVGDNLFIYFAEKPIKIRKLKIKGIFSTGLSEYDEKFALTDIKHIQQLNQWEDDDVGGFEVFLKDTHQNTPIHSFLSGFTFYVYDYLQSIIFYFFYEHFGWEWANTEKLDAIDSMAEHIHYNVLPNALNARTIKEKQTNIFEWLKLQNVNRLVILVLMALVAVINMITVLLIIILERTNMIGILKALGAPNWRIRKIFLYNSAFTIGLGLIIGNIIGIGLCLLQQEFGFIRLPEESYYIQIAPVSLDFFVIAGLNLGTIVICIFALILPSYLVTRIDPIKAIRFS
ncbi:MAG: FtsX-like permease family protein [Chitinophagales bacterium]